MSSGNGHTWSKFWWRDHQGDAALRMCSLAARGLWVELLALCHASEKPGYLLVNGAPPTVNELADMLGKATAKEINKLLTELEVRRVFSREDGVIYSRRMVRDAVASEQGREHVSKRYQGHNPDPPSRGATSKPNGEAAGTPRAEPYRPLYRDPSTKKLEAEAEARPPRGPPVTGGAARRDSKNVFHDLARELDGPTATTIEGTAEDADEAKAFHLRLVAASRG